MSCKEFLESLKSCVLDESRDPSTVSLLPVSKGHSSTHVRKVLLENPDLPKILGENYLQELQSKSKDLSDLDIQWHYIGNVQSKKLKEICSIVSVIHSIGREKEIKILANIESSPNFYLQFNISGEKSKGGFRPEAAKDVCDLLSSTGLHNKCLGLMCSAAPVDDVGVAEVKKEFAALRELRDQYFKGKDLNMGMSSDYALAVGEGANVIRVGSLIFGPRNYQ